MAEIGGVRGEMENILTENLDERSEEFTVVWRLKKLAGCNIPCYHASQ